ncbi:MAG: acyl carrier protein [Planctomycetes bacterium]|nr:acyl carrier protein [Planctomycetota bacterium]
MDSTLARLNEIFCDVFDDEEIVLTRETSARDIEAWDSLMHVTLMLNVEKAFGIRISSADIAALKNVGELEDLVTAYTQRKSQS